MTKGGFRNPLRILVLSTSILLLFRSHDSIEAYSLGSKIDLHTHFSGVLPPETIWTLGIRNQFLYPLKQLEAHQIDVNPSQIFDQGGQAFLRLSPEALSPKQKNKFLNLMRLSENEISNFKTLERAYSIRDPFFMDPNLFPKILNEIALHYQAEGVSYVELSAIMIIFDPYWLHTAELIIPDIERRTGVSMRFLAGIRRDWSLDFMSEVLGKISQLQKQYPILLGVDFLGEELNSTKDFAPAITFAREIFGDQGVVRVHAGENPDRPENLETAAESGATRIGHGIFGLHRRSLELLKHNRVTVEFNPVSNLRLGYTPDTKVHIAALRQYRLYRIPITLGSDGLGMLNTTMQGQSEALLGEGFSPREVDYIHDISPHELLCSRVLKQLSPPHAREKVPV